MNNPRETNEILLDKKIIMFKEISLCTFLEYYSTMMDSKFHSILLKNGRENSTETGLLAKKYAKLVKRI